MSIASLFPLSKTARHRDFSEIIAEWSKELDKVGLLNEIK